MSQIETDKNDGKERQVIIDQYRDWLIPGTVFSGVAASIFILAITAKGPGYIFLAVLICSFASMGMYVLALFYAFTRIESLAILRVKAVREPGLLYFLAVFGTLLLFVSLVILAFTKSTLFGACIAVIFGLFVLVFIVIMRYESRMPEN